MSDEFHSRWGDDELDDKGYLNVPGYVMRHYNKFTNGEGKRVGLGSRGFEFMSQVMSFKWDRGDSEAKPSLSTVAERMGLDVRSVRRIARTLAESGAMTVIPQPGKPNIYEFGRLVKQCRKHQVLSDDKSVTPDKSDMGTPDKSVTPPLTNLSPEDIETKKRKEESIAPPLSTKAVEAKKPYGISGFVSNGSAAAKETSNSSDNDRQLSKLEEIIKRHGVARLTESQAAKLKKPGFRVKDDGTSDPLPSPHEYIEQGNVTFEKFIKRVIDLQEKYKKGKNISRTSVVNHIIGYGRKDGWITYEEKYGFIDNRPVEDGYNDPSLDPLDLGITFNKNEI